MSASAILSDLRSAGWAVAVHNDYQQNGEPHTFWLMTKGGLAAKGEGRTDDEALARLAGLVAEIEPPAATASPPEHVTTAVDYALNWCPSCHHGVTTDDDGKCDKCGEWTQAPFDAEDAQLSGQAPGARAPQTLPSYRRTPGGPELFLWWWNPRKRALSGQATTADIAGVLKELDGKGKVAVLRMLLDMDPSAQRSLLFSNGLQMQDWYDRTRAAEGALRDAKAENERLHEELQQIDDILQMNGYEQGNAVRDVQKLAVALAEEQERLDGARDALLKLEAETYAEDGLAYRRMHSMACQGLLASAKEVSAAQGVSVDPADADPGLNSAVADSSSLEKMCP